MGAYGMEVNGNDTLCVCIYDGTVLGKEEGS